MTRNQIDYLKLQEEKQHNRNVEKETQRTNLANEELIRKRDLGTLGLRQAELTETQRHNMYGEKISLALGDETKRSNQAKEAENYRHNYANEQISASQVGAAYQNAQAALNSASAAQSNAAIRAAELNALMDYRNDQIQLGYDQLHVQDAYNQGRLNIDQQNADSNKINAFAASDRVKLGWEQLNETTRHNQNTERTEAVGTASKVIGSIGRGIVGAAVRIK